MIVAVAGRRHASRLADDADDTVLRERLRARRARVVEDRLLVHRAIDIVRAEPERHLRDRHREHHPVRLDMREIVQHEPRDRERPQIVPHARLLHRLPQLRMRRQERETDEREKPARLILQIAQREQMIHALLERLDMAVEHRRVRADAELVRRPLHGEPLRRRRLVRTETAPHAVGEDLRAAARNGLEPRLIAQAREHLSHGEPARLREMRDLDAREPLDIELWERLVQRAHDIEILLERPGRMQPRDDMQPREIRIAHRVAHDGDRLRLRHRISARVLRIPPERAELAAARADIREIHMTVHIIIDDIAALAPAHRIRQSAEPGDVVTVEQTDAVRARQALTAQDLLLDVPILL